jgi:hypothetical protein
MKPVILRVLDIIFAPIMESNKFSIGRSMLLSCFSLAMWKWKQGIEITNTHETALLVLLGYVLGTKGLNAIKEVINKVQDTKKVLAGNGDTSQDSPK